MERDLQRSWTVRESELGADEATQCGWINAPRSGDPVAGWAEIIKRMRTCPFGDATVDERTAVLEAESGGVRVRVEVELIDEPDPDDNQTRKIDRIAATARLTEAVAVWTHRAFVSRVLARHRDREAVSA